MPWVRIDENAMDHPKIGGLSDGAFRLWVQGLAYCQKYLTDGVVNRVALRGLRAYSPKRRAALVAARLWDELADGGVEVHDYLQWNDSKEVVLANRDSGKRRVALLRDSGLRQSIRQRDGDECRYCGRTVEWKDRKGERGGTYDHVDPCVGNTLENLVVCCRGCNSRKGRRTPGQAQMVLREPRFGSRSDLSLGLRSTSGVEGEDLPQASQAERERGSGGKPAAALVEDDLANRAGRFCERYAELFSEYRRGARYYPRPALDFEEAVNLCATWDDSRLETLVIAFLTTDDRYCREGSGGIKHFASRASWCDGKLRERGL